MNSINSPSGTSRLGTSIPIFFIKKIRTRYLSIRLTVYTMLRLSTKFPTYNTTIHTPAERREARGAADAKVRGAAEGRARARAPSTSDDFLSPTP